jgi:hypothetical protein
LDVARGVLRCVLQPLPLRARGSVSRISPVGFAHRRRSPRR